MQENEAICFQLISNAGASRSSYFQAIQKNKAEEYESSRLLFEEGITYYKEAHRHHSQLVQKEASGDTVWMSLLMTHGEDLMMSAEITREFSNEIMSLQKEIAYLKVELEKMVLQDVEKE